jgi:hypothetical protein
MIMYGDKIMIIDNNTIRNIETTTNMMGYAPGFCYFAWPSTNLFTIYFSGNANRTIEYSRNYMEKAYHENYNIPSNVNEIRITKNLRDTMRKILPEFTTKNISSISKNIFPEKDYVVPLQNNGEIQRSVINLINHLKNKLLHQKLLSPAEIEIELYNTYPSKFSSVEEFKIDILKRIDLYSFGIILAQIFTRIMNIHSFMNIPISDKLLGLYGGFYKVIIYNFCYQQERVVNIDLSVNTYWDMIDELNNIIKEEISYLTPAPVPVPVSVPVPVTTEKRKRESEEDQTYKTKILRTSR